MYFGSGWTGLFQERNTFWFEAAASWGWGAYCDFGPSHFEGDYRTKPCNLVWQLLRVLLKSLWLDNEGVTVGRGWVGGLVEEWKSCMTTSNCTVIQFIILFFFLQCTWLYFSLLGVPLPPITTATPPVTSGESIILCTFTHTFYLLMHRMAYRYSTGQK